MEVYVDDMLVKSKMTRDHIEHLNHMLNNLRKYRMKLNSLKCVFWVLSGKFLGFIINQHRIEAHPEKINVLLEMSSPSVAFWISPTYVLIIVWLLSKI